MSDEKRSEITEPTETEEANESIAERFPNPETDERLNVTATTSFPEVPDVKFERPVIRTVQLGKGLADPEKAKKPQVGSLSYESAEDAAEGTRKTAIASTAGINLVAALLLGAGLGWLIDRFLLGSPTTPWGMIIGLLLGIAAGFVSLMRIASQLQGDDKQK